MAVGYCFVLTWRVDLFSLDAGKLRPKWFTHRKPTALRIFPNFSLGSAPKPHALFIFSCLNLCYLLLFYIL